jgi:hypothetical protein
MRRHAGGRAIREAERRLRAGISAWSGQVWLDRTTGEIRRRHFTAPPIPRGFT